MSMLCNNDRVCWVIFHFIKLLHSKHRSSFLQNFSMRCFRCGKKNTVQKPITRCLNNNFILESTPSRSFDFVFCFFFFLQSCSAVAKCSIPGFIFPFIYEGTKMCLNFKFCETRGNTDLRVGAKLTT